MITDQPALLILTPGFAKDEADTTCLPLQQNLVKAIKNNFPGLQIIILSFQYPYVEQTYDWFGITVISFNGQNKGGLQKLLLRRKINATLNKINTNHTIIGLLSFWYGECAFAAKKFARKNHLRHLCWLLGQDAKKDNKLPRKLKLKGDELMALSDFLQGEFERNHVVKPAYVVPPGIAANNVAEKEGEREIDIIAVGSLIPLKQYDVFIKVITAIKKQKPFIKAILIGDGVENDALQKLVHQNNLTQNITLIGALSHPKVLQMMRQAKIFLHTAAYEGFGVVMLEALAAGCHVISFCKPMQQEIKSWQIVNDKEEMIEKAVTLLQSDLDFEKVLPFTIDATAKNIMKLFGYIANNSPVGM